MNPFNALEQETLRKNLHQLIRLRGMAFYGHVGVILVAYYGLNVVLPLPALFGVIAVMVAFNLFSFYRYKTGKTISEAELCGGLAVDVIGLSGLLYFSGGTGNPFITLYFFPMIVASVLLKRIYAWLIFSLALAAYLLLSLNTPTFPHPPPTTHGGFDLQTHGLLISFCIVAALLVIFVSRITENLKAHEQQLAAMRQQAADEAHILRMGLLSAGAAHELGTPLTTLSVILGDWAALPPPRKAERAADIATMQAQVARCKAIVSGILMASGDVRGEGARVMPLKAFLTEVTQIWQTSKQIKSFDLSLKIPDLPVIADRVLEQALFNLLDNAIEASRANGQDGVSFSTHTNDNQLMIDINDQGAGFPADVLAALGQPYNSNKSEGAGRGLGLFLVVNTMRKLGGEMTVDNGATGARVRLSLPLAAISVPSKELS